MQSLTNSNMPDREIKVIKRGDIERQSQYERAAEIAYLEIMIRRNVEAARRFVKKHVEIREDAAVE